MNEVEFVDFFRAVHGVKPFHWQKDLALEVVEHGWPSAVDVPTGLGKTALIDIAVYVAGVHGVGDQLPGRRRTFFVIDRRVVVDEAFEHANHLADLLATAPAQSALEAVADGLRLLCTPKNQEPPREDDGPPLVAARMRGGVTWSWRWLDRPDRAAVVVGTVDQLGSRFLFQGYGVGPNLRPIDAALVGTDSLMIIDEAHLAGPLVETVNRAAELESGEIAFARPLILTMSATPPVGDARSTFQMKPEAHRDGEAGKRLYAAKRLHTVAVSGKRDISPVLAQLATEAVTTDDTDRRAVGVICNTVQVARQVAEEIRAKVDLSTIDVALLTGRVRGLDGERIRDQVWPAVGVGRDRDGSRPTILVATQTVEVGANIDLDVLVTESAPIDALTQRLGRLNRLGDLRDTRCYVVHHDLPQGLYGPARDLTWHWLADLDPPAIADGRGLPDVGPGIDVCPATLRDLISAHPNLGSLLAPTSPAPTLFRAQIRDWAATSLGKPIADPAPFLHGLGALNDDVHLVWRADLPPIEPAERDVDDEEPGQGWQDAVDALPPVTGEQLAIPLNRVRRWMQGLGASAEEVADVPGVAPEATPSPANPLPPRHLTESYCLVWRGPGEGQLIPLAAAPSRLRPGDIVILPSSVGGCDHEGWAPRSTMAVPDVAELAIRPGGDFTLRLDPRTLPSFLAGMPEEVLPDLSADLRDLAEDLEESIDRESLDEDLADLYARFREAVGPERIPNAKTVRALHTSALPERFAPWRYAVTIRIEVDPSVESQAMVLGYGADGGAASSSASGQPVPLDQHLAAVGKRVSEMGGNLDLPPEITEAAVRAATWHDVGKWDPRFQVMLHAGDESNARASLLAEEPLAKSGMDPGDRSAYRRAHQRSGLPRGYRHEVGSAQAAAHLSPGDGIDGELVHHLVASHHGHARPLLPPVADTGSPFTAQVDGVRVEIDPARSVDLDHPARFARLTERYGTWGLALLETIVRLSDIGCSEEGS